MKILKIIAAISIPFIMTSCGGPESLGKEMYQMTLDCDKSKKGAPIKAKECIDRGIKLKDKMCHLSEEEVKIAYDTFYDLLFDHMEEVANEEMKKVKNAYKGEKEYFLANLKSQREAEKRKKRSVPKCDK